MPVSPLENADGPVRIVISSDGMPMEDSAALISATVCRAVNKVPSARLVFSDGELTRQAFPLSDSARLRPGAEVTVSAGYGDNEAAIFSGIVVKQGLRISGGDGARLVVECRDSVLDGKVTVAEPTGGAAALRVAYGEDLIEFEAELDVPVQAPQPGSGRSRLRGRVRFPGSALAEVGGLIELAGVGERFGGSVLATGLTHRIDQSGWTTEVEFGAPVAGFSAQPDVVAPPAAVPVPGSQRPPALALRAGNPIKSIVTRCKARVEFDDENAAVTFATPGRNTVVLSDKDQSITLTDETGNRVRLGPAGITLDSPKDIQITSQGAITMSALGPLTLSANADVRVAGLNVTCEAQVGITATGSASAELSAGGQTTVKGAMVMIN